MCCSYVVEDESEKTKRAKTNKRSSHGDEREHYLRVKAGHAIIMKSFSPHELLTFKHWLANLSSVYNVIVLERQSGGFLVSVPAAEFAVVDNATGDGTCGISVARWIAGHLSDVFKPASTLFSTPPPVKSAEWKVFAELPSVKACVGKWTETTLRTFARLLVALEDFHQTVWAGMTVWAGGFNVKEFDPCQNDPSKLHGWLTQLQALLHIATIPPIYKAKKNKDKETMEKKEKQKVTEKKKSEPPSSSDDEEEKKPSKKEKQNTTTTALVEDEISTTDVDDDDDDAEGDEHEGDEGDEGDEERDEDDEEAPNKKVATKKADEDDDEEEEEEDVKSELTDKRTMQNDKIRRLVFRKTKSTQDAIKRALSTHADEVADILELLA